MNELVPTGGIAIMPIMKIVDALERRQAIVEFTKQIMVEGVDFGTIPGTGGKPTLLKPGAEKLTSFFGLSPRFEIVKEELDWTGEHHGGEAFFYFHYRCTLWYGSFLAGEGLGSCNSFEKKYRWRTAERVCPECGKATIFKSKPRPNDAPGTKYGYYCWQKKGGCGFQFPASDQRIESQEVGQIPNENPADLVNTLDKMAQKRALIAAALIAINASEFFTQDIEDMDYSGAIDAEYTVREVRNEPAKTQSNGTPVRPPVVVIEQEPAKPTTATLRSALERNAKPTVGTVASMSVSLGLFANDTAALDAVALWPVANGQRLVASKSLKPETALALFDWLVSQPAEPIQTAADIGVEDSADLFTMGVAGTVEE